MTKPGAILLRSHILPAFVVRLRTAGADELLCRHGIAADADPTDLAMPLATFRALCDEAAALLGDPFLGLHLAQSVPRGNYGLLEFVFRSARTVREAVEELVRFVPLVNSLLAISMEEEAGHCAVEERIAGEPLCLGRHANEFALANVVRIGRDLVGDRFPVERVWFAHPSAGRPVDELANHFETRRIEFGTGRNGVQVSSKLLDMPVRTADAPLFTFLERAAAERAAKLSAADSFEDVRQSIRRQLSHGEPSVERVAADLSTSPRSLQRRLSEGGTSFRALADEVRRAIAELYLEDHRRPLTEVAFVTGYSDLRAFVRAYRRWTGRTPGAQRKGR